MRKEQGLSLNDLAFNAGISPARASRAMGLRTEPRCDKPQEVVEDHVAARLALAMNVDPRDVGA